MRYLWITSLTLLSWACQPQAAHDTSAETETADTVAVSTLEPDSPEFLYTPGSGFGQITPGITSSELRAQVGDTQVKDHEFYIGEGYSEPGLLVYPDSPQELEILLTNDSLSLIRVTKDESPWQTAAGIRIGSSLEEVVTANGNDFELMGFEWDYGGTVTDWQGGQFADQDFLMRFTLSYGNERLPREDLQAIIGDQVISSAHPALAKYEVTVIEMVQR